MILHLAIRLREWVDRYSFDLAFLAAVLILVAVVVPIGLMLR